MKIEKIVELVDGELLCGQHLLEEEILHACSSDLMSDVLAFVKENVVLLTGLIHPQVIRTAEMLDIKAIVTVRGKKPTDELVEMACSRDIAIIWTKHTLFTTSGILYKNGLLGEEL